MNFDDTAIHMGLTVGDTYCAQFQRSLFLGRVVAIGETRVIMADVSFIWQLGTDPDMFFQNGMNEGTRSRWRGLTSFPESQTLFFEWAHGLPEKS